MPSVGMRRTTRVFGVVKGSDTACVLRSGRRLWPDSVEEKTRRGNEGEEWMKKPGKRKMNDDNDEDDDIGILEMVKQRNRRARILREEQGGRDRYFGIVYSRKRKRSVANDESKMFGLQFHRRQRRKNRCVLAVVVKPSSEDIGLFSRFLFRVLRRVTRFGLTLKDLSDFVLSEPISAAYASRGIQFLQGSVTANVGICQFFGITRFMPLFCVDFSAVPLCFKYLNTTLILRYLSRSFFLVCNPENDPSDVEEEIDLPDFRIELQIVGNSFKTEASESGTIRLTPEVIEINDSLSLHASESGTIALTPEVIEINDSLSLHASVKCSRIAGRIGQYKKKNAKRVQKRRTSLRKRKARNPSTKNRSNGALASDSKNGPKKSIAGVASNKKLKSLTDGCTGVSLSEANSATADSKEGMDSSYCSANILIAESDRCYRVEGAVVTLEETPDSREWHLVVKKDGLTRFTFKADKVMRPCSSNRYTQVKMVSLENGWKLEFAKHQDWLVFKDLYKECSDRNIPAPVFAKFIPVPGVHDVSDYADSYTVPFSRPDSYISVNGDEFYRAMTRKTANYDMDSEDEEWLSKFNNEFQEHVSEDNFELIVDALEKAYYYDPDDCYDEKAVANWCQNLVSKEAVEAVHSYWMRKRKQKCSSLLRVFQSYQSKRYPFVPKPLLRKKRSFKRHPSQINRCRLPTVLQAIAAEQDVLEHKNDMVRIEAAKVAANESKEVAIEKRKRAQSLMENADLAIYKATMLVRIAEAAQAGGSVDALAGHFLD